MDQEEQMREYVQRQIETVREALDQYREERATADRQITKLSENLEVLQAMLGLLTQPGGELAEFAAVEEGMQEPRSYTEMTIADAAFDVLRRSPGTLHVTEIWAALDKGGKTSKAERPTLSVTAALLRDERFQNMGKNRFRIKELPSDENEKS